LNPAVPSVASLFVSRWDVAIKDKVPRELGNRLGIAVAQRTYRIYRQRLASDRLLRLANLGARPQRLLWASTGTKDPAASDTLYVEALAAPFTINTMPDGTLKALLDHGHVHQPLAADGGDCDELLAAFEKAGVDLGALAVRLQEEGAAAFVKSWTDLMDCIGSKSAAIRKAS
jgi:transaldolase